MIKFFRKIRQSLLSENKFSKYLLYAIGEIILVVIGILIALQINNANEKSKEDIVLKGYLKNISKNLETDIKDLNEIKTFRDSVKRGASIFMKITSKEKMTHQDFMQYANPYMVKYNAFFDTYFRADKSGFETLKNSGYLGKIQGSELETKLFQYYNLISKIESEETSFNNFIEQMEYEVFREGVVLNFIDRIKILNENSTEKEFSEVQNIMQSPAFRGANFRSGGFNNLIQNYVDATEIADELLLLLRHD